MTAVQLPYSNPSFYDDIQFSLKVKKLNIFSDVLAEGEPELEQVVDSVDVLMTATYNDGSNIFTASQQFGPGLPYPTSEEGFASYSSLTESQIVSWIEQQDSYNGYKNCLALNLAEQVARAYEPGLPWD